MSLLGPLSVSVSDDRKVNEPFRANALLHVFLFFFSVTYMYVTFNIDGLWVFYRKSNPLKPDSN